MNYLDFIYCPPYKLRVSFANDVLKIIAIQQNACYNKTITNNAGQQIMSIDGIPIQQHLESLGYRIGRTKDKSVQFNYALYNFADFLDLSSIQLPLVDSQTWSFANGMNETLGIVFIPQSSFANLTEFSKKLKFSKKSSTELPIYHQRINQPKNILESTKKTKSNTPSFQLIEKTSDSSLQYKDFFFFFYFLLFCISTRWGKFTSSSGEEIHLIYISSFLPKDVIEFKNKAKNFLASVSSSESKKILIDVRLNGGGLVIILTFKLIIIIFF